MTNEDNKSREDRARKVLSECHDRKVPGEYHHADQLLAGNQTRVSSRVAVKAMLAFADETVSPSRSEDVEKLIETLGDFHRLMTVKFDPSKMFGADYDRTMMRNASKLVANLPLIIRTLANQRSAEPIEKVQREIARMRECASDWRRPALAQIEGPNDLKIYGGTIADDIDLWADMLAVLPRALPADAAQVQEDWLSGDWFEKWQDATENADDELMATLEALRARVERTILAALAASPSPPAKSYTQAEVEALVRLARAAEASRYDPGENLTGLSDDEFIARLFRSPLYVIEGNISIKPDSLEDGGEAMIVQLDDETPGSLGGDPQMFVRLQSWHDGAKKTDTDSHPRLRSLLGRRVRITIEDLGEHQ